MQTFGEIFPKISVSEFNSLDLNGDGKISKYEFRKMLLHADETLNIDKIHKLTESKTVNRKKIDD